MHIVCLDAPAPPNYGGAIDMYYKVKALASIGKKIRLHYFQYQDNRDAGALEALCDQVYVYERKKNTASLLSSLPFIVQSRIDPLLISRLNADEHPVLLEGLHCSGLLPHLKEPARAVIRMHNEEAEYYGRLASCEPSFFKKIYLKRESRLLKRYYRHLPKDQKLAVLSSSDIDVLQQVYGFRHCYFIPCFIPWQQLNSLKGIGDYCLYHGNMRVPENESAANWLIDAVFSRLPYTLVIAGGGISSSLAKKAKAYNNVRLIADPPMEELNVLVKEAQINVLPSMNNTGVKLKLLHALFEGRFCIVNENGVRGSHIESGLQVASDAEAFSSLVRAHFHTPFSAADKKNRQALLSVYNNDSNARLLSALW